MAEAKNSVDQLRWQEAQKLFHQALSLPLPARAAYLENAAQHDSSLVAEVAAMLEEDQRSESLLDLPLEDLAHSVMAALPNSVTNEEFEKYYLIRLLGEGGSGVVFLAERKDIHSIVAIKILSGGTLSPSRRQRFADEQKTLAQLDHPGIAHILDAGTLRDGTPWFAMEYVEGVPISDYCRQQQSSIEQRLLLFRSACEAVQYAHSHAIIHRDLKPSNILVRNDGTLKLLDFGIAKRLDVDDQDQPTLTRTGHRPMTLAYASPEQIRGLQINTQSDVYSLGIVFYELLTGHLPFDLSNKTTAEAEQTVMEFTAQPPSLATDACSSLPKSMRSDLDVLCLTAMHRDPQRRYRSVEALTRDIDHYLKGEPLEARPDSLRYRMAKYIRRNRRVLSISIAAALGVAALILFFMIRLTIARNRVLAEAERSQKIEQFMLNLFDSGDKDAAPADHLRAVSLIDRGALTARALNQEPDVQADLYQTLGNIYRKLGRFDSANKLIASFEQQRKKLYGADSPEEAQALVSLGLLRLDQSQVDEAEKSIRQGLAISQRRLPADDPQTAFALSALGHVLIDKGSYPQAIQLLEEAVRIQSLHGSSSQELASSLEQLADAHFDSGHYDIAKSLNQRALAMDRQLYGATHPKVADILTNLGEIEHALGNDAQAEIYYRQALAIKRAWYGDDHPETAMTMSAVGEALTYQGRYDEAAGLLHQAVSIQEQFYGKVHGQVASGLNLLGMFDLKRGDLKDAEDEFTRMKDINRAIYGEKHYLTGIADLDLARVYSGQGNYPRAERSARSALDRLIEQLPPTHPYIAIARARLGHILMLEQKYQEAESNLTASLQVPSQLANHAAEARGDLAKVRAELKTKR